MPTKNIIPPAVQRQDRDPTTLSRIGSKSVKGRNKFLAATISPGRGIFARFAARKSGTHAKIQHGVEMSFEKFQPMRAADGVYRQIPGTGDVF
jgi:hypothetical protein